MKMKENTIVDGKEITSFNSSSNPFMLKYESDGESTAGLKIKKYTNTSSEKVLKNSREKSKIQKSGYASLLFKQTKLMLWKNFLVFTRSLKPTVFQLLTPILICIILVFLQILMNYYSKNVKNLNPEIVPLQNLEKCTYPEDCTTIGYGLIVKIFNNSMLLLYL
jgi:hypothetical protein